MNTRTLVVGQDVYIESGWIDIAKGTVVKVTPKGADVQTDGGLLLQFDTYGEKRYEDGSTWCLSNIPFAERTAERRKADEEARQKADEKAHQKADEKARRRDEMLKTLAVGQRWLMLSGPYCNKSKDADRWRHVERRSDDPSTW
jgi:hypothetical protein